jgi:hypothetical protein
MKAKGFWNDLDGFSLKDLISITFTISFVGTLIYSLVTKDVTAISLVSVQIPIILTILGLYSGSEIIASKINSNSSITSTTENNSTPSTGNDV